MCASSYCMHPQIEGENDNNNIACSNSTMQEFNSSTAVIFSFALMAFKKAGHFSSVHFTFSLHLTNIDFHFLQV